MLLTALGAIGIGLVWGWLVGTVETGIRRPLLTGISVSVATGLIGALVYVFGDWIAILFFLGAALITFLLSLGWRRQLASNSQGRSG